MDKYCVDCKHKRPALVAFFYGECASPNMPMVTSLVTGKSVAKYEYCSTLRSNSDQCGPNAKWFEAKP